MYNVKIFLSHLNLGNLWAPINSGWDKILSLNPRVCKINSRSRSSLLEVHSLVHIGIG